MKKVLIVDDSMLSRAAVKMCLSGVPDLVFHEAADGSRGVEFFREIRPDITVLDLTMPVMSGFDALREMRGIDPRALVIVLSADAQRKTIDMVTELGAFRILRKPPQKPEVIEAVHEALRRLAERS